MESKHTTFVRGAGLLSALTLISRILGLVRESVCAYFFGVGAVWDDFMMAFCVPNLSRRVFGEGALSGAFVPVMSEKLSRNDRQGARKLLGRLLTLLAAVLCAATLVGELILLAFRSLLPPAILQLTAIMLPYMVFICMVALMAAAHHALGRFAAPAMMPIFFNVFFVVCAVLAVQCTSELSLAAVVLALGVVLAGALQLVLQWTALRREDCAPLLSWRPRDADLVRIRRVMAPMILGVSAVQINTLGDLLVARIFVSEVGGVSSLTYAMRLYQLPVGMFGAALATAILPGLSELVSKGDDRGFSRLLQGGLRLALFVGIPATVGLCLVRSELVGVIFEHGEFTAEDTPRVARVVLAYGLGVWAYIAQQVLVRGFYAHRETASPMRIAVSMVIVNLALNLVLVHWLQEAGIAMATAASAAIQMALLLRSFPRHVGPLAFGSIAGAALRASAASAIMAAAVLAVRAGVAPLGIGRGLGLAIGVGAGVLAYGAVAFAARFPELQQLRSGLRGRQAAPGE